MITVTEIARSTIVRKAGERYDESGRYPSALRVGIRGGGCTGYSYVFEWADDIRGDLIIDEMRKSDYEVKLYLVIDPKSIPFLEGSTLDFEKTLMSSGFKWINPKQTGSCGCGKSVSF